MATRRDTELPDLKMEVAAILLHGWAANPPAGVDPGPHGFSHGMLELFDHDGPATLWRLHERYLRTTAARWHWEPQVLGPDGVKRFWAEAIAAGFRE